VSTSDQMREATDFDSWLTAEFAKNGAFTTLVILVDIAETQVTPLCSTYFHVIGDDVGWDDIVVMFAGSGADWDGAAFFAVSSPESELLDNPTARLRLRDLEARFDQDRLVLNEGAFFDNLGQRLKIEEVTAQ
jgi:hypothetical protein